MLAAIKNDMYLVLLLFSSDTVHILDGEKDMDKAEIAVNIGELQCQRRNVKHTRK